MFAPSKASATGHYPPAPSLNPSVRANHHFLQDAPRVFFANPKSNHLPYIHQERGVKARAVEKRQVSPWDEKPYEIVTRSGKKSYLDEQDVVSFLDPPKELIPLDPSSYNPAAYLWKKIEDIPEERRHRLLDLIKPRLIFKAWQIAGMRYEDEKLAKKSASKLLCFKDGGVSLEFYSCRSSGGSWHLAWMKNFKMAIFHCSDGKTYGRCIGGTFQLLNRNSMSPLYFLVTEQKEVMSTGQPCDLAYEFGDGQLDLQHYPLSFPRPGKHPYPFNDHVVIYVRHVGPGVLIGQAWQEGNELHQVPLKLCGEILMVKNYDYMEKDP